MFNLKANDHILNFLQRTKREREKKPFVEIHLFPNIPTAYAHFGSLKKLSYTKFMLVGLY